MDDQSPRQVVPQHRGGALSLIASFRPHKHPKAAGVGLLWLLGLWTVFLAPAPVKITPEKLQLFQARIQDAEALMPELTHAERVLMEAELSLRQVQVWFWRWRPEHRAVVTKRQPAVRAAKEKARELRRQRDAILRQAKQHLGVWSEAGLEESRALLWGSFEAGKVFAQRQTFWDSLFHVFDSRDKDWLYLLLQLLFTALVNYTIGTVLSIITFTLSLPGMLASFAPSFASAAAFFAVALLGAVSLVASYLLLLYAAGGAVVYTAASFAAVQRERQLPGGEGERRRRLQYERQHYD